MAIRRARSVLAIVLVALAAHVSAADWYVAAAGSGAKPGTAAQPFRQIRKALTVVHAGDSVVVGDGQYLGFTLSGINGAAGSPITIRASGANAQGMATPPRARGRAPGGAAPPPPAQTPAPLFLPPPLGIVRRGPPLSRPPRGALRP